MSSVSFSMIVDQSSPTNTSYMHCLEEQTRLRHIQGRQRSIWVDDAVVKKCFSCGISFTFYIRPHHCRKCGNIFCYTCSQHYVAIPEFVGDLPTEPQSLKCALNNLIWSSKKVRVCNECNREICEIKRLNTLFCTFDLIPITILDYKVLKLTCKNWNKVANHYLSKFRELQYKLPYHSFSPSETRLLHNNAELIQGHSMYLTSLLRIGGEIRNENKTDCIDLMCSRLCKPKLEACQIITLLDSLEPQLLEELLNGITTEDIKPYITVLINKMLQKKSKIIGDFLILQATKDMLMAGEIYWSLKIAGEGLVDIEALNLLQTCQKRLLHKVSEETVKYLEDTEAIILFLNSLSNTADIEEIKSAFKKNLNLFIDSHICTNPDLICKKVIIENIKVKRSTSTPIFIPFECYNTRTKSKCYYYLLYKFEDVRRDLVIISTIRLMEKILNAELHYQCQTDDIHIITYNVLPTSKRSGLIEIIPNCHTLYEIQKRFTIFNYILENNRGKGFSADELRRRFLKSCAAYCVMTYLLGVGDRHLENIMVNTEGYLFHIDYGFIMGADPKPVSAPAMRITTDMVDALGGTQSRYYREFVRLSKAIHLCLQKRLPIFYTLLMSLIEMKPGIKDGITKDRLINELTSRFMYGETYEQTGEQLSIHISNSSGSYNQAIIDFFHYHSKENTVGSVLSGTVSWIGSFIS